MKVCFLGLGSMGSGVCRNLLNKGYALQVWNRSPEKAAKVAGWGAEAFATPQEAARGAGVVLSCLSSVAALKAVAGGANGVFSCMGKGMAFYDMGTWGHRVRPRSGGGSREARRLLRVHAHGQGARSGRGRRSPPCSSAAQRMCMSGIRRSSPEDGRSVLPRRREGGRAFKLITNLIGLSNNVILTEGVFLAKRMGLSEEAFLNGAKVHWCVVLPDAELGA